jgi:hypothetical protein
MIQNTKFTMKNIKGNHSKIMIGKIINLVNGTPPKWDLFTYKHF